MHTKICSIGTAAIVILLSALAAAADEGGNEANPPAAAVPANTPEQIKKAQVELKRLDCLTGRIDGKLGERTREAVKKFWASAKQPPPADIAITNALIADLSGRGDNYCRPARHVFFSGGGGNAAKLPFFAPGGKAAPAPPPVQHPPEGEAQ